MQQRSLVGGVSWNRNWSDRFETTALLYGSYYLLNATNKDLFTTQQQFQENEVLEDGAKVDSRFTFSEKIKLKSGYQFSEIGIGNTQDVNIPRFRTYNKEVLHTHSVFSNVTYTPNQQNTVINAGVRASYFDKFDEFLIEPRLSIHQKLGNGFSVEAMGEFKSQTTSNIKLQEDYDKAIKDTALSVEKMSLNLDGESSIDFLVSEESRKSIPDTISQMSHWRNEDGSWNHKAVVEDGLRLTNFDAMIKLAYEQGVSSGKDGIIRETKNVNLNDTGSSAQPTRSFDRPVYEDESVKQGLKVRFGKK